MSNLGPILKPILRKTFKDRLKGTYWYQDTFVFELSPKLTERCQEPIYVLGMTMHEKDKRRDFSYKKIKQRKKREFRGTMLTKELGCLLDDLTRIMLEKSVEYNTRIFVPASRSFVEPLGLFHPLREYTHFRQHGSFGPDLIKVAMDVEDYIPVFPSIDPRKNPIPVEWYTKGMRWTDSQCEYLYREYRDK